MKSVFWKNKKNGFTLVEIIVSIAIVGMILSILISMNVFGGKTFKRGSDRSQNQYDVRMAADFITKKLRYAESIEIKDITTPPSGKNCLYLKNSGGKAEILYYSKGNPTSIPGVSDVSDYTLSFKKVDDKRIQFTVGKVGTNDYDIDTEVTILNASDSSAITIKYINNRGVVINYK